MDNETDLQIFDKCFPFLQEYGVFNLELALPNEINFNEPTGLTRYAPGVIGELLKKYGYAEITQLFAKDGWYAEVNAELMPRGREAKKAGGHFAYLKQLEYNEQEEKEKKNLEMQKLRADVENLTNLLADYPKTQIRAKLALWISILAAALTSLGLLIKWLYPNSN